MKLRSAFRDAITLLKSSIGVYRIYNIFNGKSYIGSSKTLAKRWREHSRDLRRNQHHAIQLQRSWNKWGELAFNIEVLEYCEEKDLTRLEQFYLDLEQSYNKNFGYNICPLARTNRGYKQSEELILKKKIEYHIRETLRKAGLTNSRKPYYSRAVKCICNITNTETVYESIREAERKNGLPNYTLGQNLRRKLGSYHVLKKFPHLTFGFVC